MKGLSIATMLLASTMETVGTEPDLVKYGITQGGLLAVVMVLLFFYRRDFLGEKDRLEREKERAAEKAELATAKTDAKTDVLMRLVSENTVAMSRSVDAIRQLADVVERLDERRSAQRFGAKEHE
jgi:hypothetical protein